MYGDNCNVSIKTAKFFGRPVKAIANVKKEDPANMKAIMQDVFVAPNNDLVKDSFVKLFWK